MDSFFESEDDSRSTEDYLNGLDDEEFLRLIGKYIKEEFDQLNNDDFVLNKPQFAKLLASYAFFKELAERQNIRVELGELEPKRVSGGLEVTGLIIDFSGEDLQKFSQIMSYASCLSIDSCIDGTVCLGIVIPDVFKYKYE